MKPNKLNRYLLGLLATLTLCINAAHSATQSGRCTYAKYLGGEVASWTMEYTDNKTADVFNSLVVRIGAINPTTFTPSHSSVRTTRSMPGAPTEYTYGNFALTGLSNITFHNPEAEVLQIPHKEEERISKVEGKRIVSLALNKGQNPRDSVQFWTITYKSATVGWKCHADLRCNVTGPGVLPTIGNSAPDGSEEDECSAVD